mmetsp:Transcript_18267/g.27171  ORF Transcript_18267/g.27171 Transcript_18267/m.27171 type:complete len:993 (+) Transcript_18267:124-3102(+)
MVNRRKKNRQRRGGGRRHQQQIDACSSSSSTPCAVVKENFVMSSAPGCYVAHFSRRPLPCWVIGYERFDCDDIDMSDAVPDICIDPETGLLSVINKDKTTVKCFYLSIVGQKVYNVKKIPFKCGVFRDKEGKSHPCTTFIVLVEPTFLMDICFVQESRKIDLYSDISEILKPPSTLNLDSIPTSFPKYIFPLLGCHSSSSSSSSSTSGPCLINGIWRMVNGDIIDFQVSDHGKEYTIYQFEGREKVGTAEILGHLVIDDQNPDAACNHKMVGTWRPSKWKEPQPFELTFSPEFTEFNGFRFQDTKKFDCHGFALATDDDDDDGEKSLSDDDNVDQESGSIITDCVIVLEEEKAPDDFDMLTLLGPLRMHGQSEQGGNIFVKRSSADAALAITDMVMVYGDLEPPPAGFEPITVSVGGGDASFCAGPQDGRKLTLCVKKEKNTNQVVKDACMAYSWGDKIPDQFKRLYKSPEYHLDANLDSFAIDDKGDRNTKIYVCIAKAPRFTHKIASAEWETAAGTINFSVAAKTRGVRVRAHYGVGNKNVMNGILLSDGTMYGIFYELSCKYPGSSIFKFSLPLYTEIDGSYTFAEKHGSWDGFRDCFLKLGIQKDYLSQWQNGEEVFSVAGDNNTVESLLQQTFCPEMMGGSNRVRCSNCDELRDTQQYTCLTDPPSHLILTLKRFSYDYRSGKMDKLLDKVEFSPTISLPTIPKQFASDAATVFQGDNDRQANAESNQYGLYAIVVHAGTKLDGGHYYTFARDSSAPTLHLKDDPENAPWSRYDDKTITKTTWKELRSRLWASIDNSAYLLFYRRIDDHAEAPNQHVSIVPRVQQQIVDANKQFIFSELASNCSEHYLQELEIEARTRYKYTGTFNPRSFFTVPSKYSQTSVETTMQDDDQHTEPNVPSLYKQFEPSTCPHCSQTMSKQELNKHLADSPIACPTVENWKDLLSVVEQDDEKKENNEKKNENDASISSAASASSSTPTDLINFANSLD